MIKFQYLLQQNHNKTEHLTLKKSLLKRTLVLKNYTNKTIDNKTFDFQKRKYMTQL